MFILPPIPTWQSLHPLVVHFPIALLITAPLLVLIAAGVTPEKARPYLFSGFLLMFLGTMAILVAVPSGEAAGRLADRTPEINATLELHEQLAERTRILFITLTIFFAIIVFLSARLKAKGRLVTTALPLIFLGLYSVGLMNLAATAHNGGRLVHEFGVHAIIPQSPTSSGTQSKPESE